MRATRMRPIIADGKVVQAAGLTIEATGPPMQIGDLCYVCPDNRSWRIPVEVVGFRGDRILLMALGETHGIAPGSLLVPTFRSHCVPVGPGLLGRVMSSMGEPLDGGPPLDVSEYRPLLAEPPSPMERRRIVEPIATG
ncbi:MAG TPA: flagellum-specific ATP synthase FliI, partial [Candidatus Hydrogenedentes bacterium]|nr:flagellum-specific ATP synthase FliI [Candidatus Hydrogenedentota bacterium]